MVAVVSTPCSEFHPGCPVGELLREDGRSVGVRVIGNGQTGTVAVSVLFTGTGTPDPAIGPIDELSGSRGNRFRARKTGVGLM